MTSVDATARFRACIRKKRLDYGLVWSAMEETAKLWGQPHLHSGRGIRRLGKVDEARFGVEWRMVFVPLGGGVLLFDFLGTHAEVRAHLRNR